MMEKLEDMMRQLTKFKCQCGSQEVELLGRDSCEGCVNWQIKEAEDGTGLAESNCLIERTLLPESDMWADGEGCSLLRCSKCKQVLAHHITEA